MKILTNINKYIYGSKFLYLVDSVLSIGFISSIYLLIYFLRYNDFISWLSSIATILTSIYSIFYHFNNRINRQRLFQELEGELLPHYKNIETIIAIHLPSISPDEFNKIEEETTKSLLFDYLLTENIYTFEEKIPYYYLSYFRKLKEIPSYNIQFLEYRILSSCYSTHFSKFASRYTDTPKENTESYLFAEILTNFIKQPDLNLENNIEHPDPIEITTIFSEVFQHSNEHIKKLLKNEELRKEVDFLLGKAFENAYTNIGILTRGTLGEGVNKIPFLFKYDERFSGIRKLWKRKIEEEASKLKNPLARESFIKSENEKLDEILDRQPFGKALAFYKECIRQVGRDYFSYIIIPERFPSECRGWRPERFIKSKIIPKAKEFQNELNKDLIKSFKYFKGLIKKKLDANYYIFYFNLSDFKAYADPKTTPNAIKDLLLKSVLETKDAPDHLLSQIIYIKQVVNSLSLSGLLFTETKEKQASLKKIEKRVLSEANKKNIILERVSDFARLGNQSETLSEIIYSILNNKKESEINKKSKSYRDIANDVKIICDNASKIEEIMRKLTNSN
ncbi:hypothetical protein [Leptospira meyeri]|uniref:hypothetical protein n=1 Tax=Leptospira meyeri TaxID=29508 RepID=UPI00223D8420|nr:hypothetical protein [Leptospira meyeri]MCW7490879.1 hypothetical protein [Leptospira meyeri]